MSDAQHRLVYVCRYCGAVVATYPAIPSYEVATLSVCDRRECREQAGADYKATA